MTHKPGCQKTTVKMLLTGWLAVLMLASGSASAELLIRITEGAGSAVPVAVVPFAETGAMPPGDKVSSIVQADLTMSGEFRTLEPSKMLSLPSKGSDVYFRDWRMLGQRYVVVGEWIRIGLRCRSRCSTVMLSTRCLAVDHAYRIS